MQDNPTYEHFVYFTYKFEWKIADDYDPKGFLTIFLPKSFPLNLKPITAAIDKRSGFFESTIDACVDDFFIDCAIRNSFLHIVRYSKSNDLKSEKYTNENILLRAYLFSNKFGCGNTTIEITSETKVELSSPKGIRILNNNSDTCYFYECNDIQL